MENEKNNYQAQLLKNRLTKKYKLLRKWARNNKICAFRLYDKDIPEIPLALDVYEFLPDFISKNNDVKNAAEKYLDELNKKIAANDLSASKELSSNRYALLFLYQRPYEKDESEENEWLSVMQDVCAEVLGIEKNHVILKVRRKQSDGEKREQYEKDEESVKEGLVFENGLLFKVNLGEYLDTGLFLDHRPLRKIVQQSSKAKSVLNLFCYTGSFSVHSKAGGAKKITSVDLSNTYLNWAKENFKINEFSCDNASFVKADCIKYLSEESLYASKSSGQRDLDSSSLYDIIVLDPPTFSNSKSTENMLDINRDWPSLVENCLNILNKNGILYFSTNSQKLKFDENLIPASLKSGLKVSVEDITVKTIDEDFKDRKPHRCWKISVS